MIARSWYIAAAATLFGCVQLASELDRVGSPPRDAATDRGLVTDQTVPNEVGVATDAPMREDDVGTTDDRPAGADVVAVMDGGAIELDAGPPGPLRLRAQGFSSGGIVAEAGGSMRLVEWGFEQGQTTCAGTLCVTGGLVP